MMMAMTVAMTMAMVRWAAATRATGDDGRQQ